MECWYDSRNKVTMLSVERNVKHYKIRLRKKLEGIVTERSGMLMKMKSWIRREVRPAGEGTGLVVRGGVRFRHVKNVSPPLSASLPHGTTGSLYYQTRLLTSLTLLSWPLFSSCACFSYSTSVLVSFVLLIVLCIPWFSCTLSLLR